MKIAIFGLGYVGLTAACCLAKQGHSIVGVDVSEAKVRQVNSGECPIEEPELPQLLEVAVREGRLLATQRADEHLDDCQVALVCVGTPSAADGSHNMTYIAEVSRQIAAALKSDRSERLTVVYRSTIRPGTIEELVMPIFASTLGDEGMRRVELVYNPEFLRESVAVKDFFDPPKIVIGTIDGERSVNMDAMNEGIQATTFYTRFREAEFTKFVDNTWHATKVAFANEIGRTCARLGISAQKVYEIFKSDTKLNISAYYMRPGGAFGGSCLPKDVRALQYIASDVGSNVSIIDSVIRSNEAHKHFLYELVVSRVSPGAKILLVGLAFKADSDDLRESPNVDLARKLLQAGYKLSIYDPHLVPAKLIGQNLGYAYTNFPQLKSLLVDEAVAKNEDFDLVVDANGRGKLLGRDGCAILSLSALA